MYANLARAVGVVLLASITILFLVYSYQYVSGLDLYEGDVVEMRECRFCGGSGTNPEFPLEGCPACVGRGEVQVILPGPCHPVLYSGLVLDALKVPESVHYVGVPVTETRRRPSPFRGHPAAIADADVTFTPPGGDPIELNTNSGGSFFASLAPGAYDVEVRAPRRDTLRAAIVVKPLTAPIWIEKVKIHEPLSDEAARSQRGMDFEALMGRKPGSSTLRVEPVRF